MSVRPKTPMWIVTRSNATMRPVVVDVQQGRTRARQLGHHHEVVATVAVGAIALLAISVSSKVLTIVV